MLRFISVVLVLIAIVLSACTKPHRARAITEAEPIERSPVVASIPAATPMASLVLNEVFKVFLYYSDDNELGIDRTHGYSQQELNDYREWIQTELRSSRDNGTYMVIVDKHNYKLHLVKDGSNLKSYSIELGANPIDDKRMEGDMCTPEGIYRTEDKRDHGQTAFYRGYLLNFPTNKDRSDFREMKRNGVVPSDATVGSGIMLHGLGSGKAPGEGGTNWTHGCVALSDEDMDDLFNYLDAGDTVVIVGTTDGLLDS